MSTENKENCNFCNNNSHADVVLKLMKSHLDKEQLCDVVLISGVDGKRVPAHRLVLSANSKFFSAMFTNPMREANDKEVPLGDVNNDVLEILVNYCYTGKLEVHDENAEMLLTTAHRWQMDSAVTACVDFMARKLDSSNCLGISIIAEQHSCTTLMELALDYINKHFVDVSQSQEFLQLDADQLKKLLASDDIRVPSEEIVFQSLMCWVRNDEPVRKQHIPKLMAKVRLPLLKLSFIEDHVESVCSANECQNLLLEAYKSQLRPERLLSIARRKNDCLLAIGNINESEHDLAIESYCPIQKQWTLLRKLELQRKYYGAAFIENKLMLVGGRTAVLPLKTMVSLDLKSMIRTQLQPMSTPRNGVSVAVLKGLLYAVGGVNSSPLNTVERWNPRTDTWSSVAPMPTKRRSVGVAVLNDCLYVIGGYDGHEYLSCVERYDPCTNEWSRLSSMSEARGYFRVEQVNGLLYAVGGRGNSKYLASVECYNHTSDKWTTVCSLSVSRDEQGCALFANRIIVAGGSNSNGAISTVEEYDPVHNVSNKLASLNTPMRNVSLFVIPHDVVKLIENP